MQNKGWMDIYFALNWILSCQWEKWSKNLNYKTGSQNLQKSQKSAALENSGIESKGMAKTGKKVQSLIKKAQMSSLILLSWVTVIYLL